MSKRELPPRSNRGKNPFYTLETEKYYDEKTRANPICLKKTSRTIVKNEVEKKLKISVQTKREIYNENKKKFIFTRGIHYFYDLGQLQRVPQSVSYAFFPSKKQKKISKNIKYTINYSQDEVKIGNTTISALINRNMIGLPLQSQLQKQIKNSFQYNQKTLNEVLEMKRNDKNQCHHYLFQAEDKKHNLDRMIAQLEFINKKIDFFLDPQNLNKLKKFSVIEKDAELSETFLQDLDLTSQEKKQILQQKIDALQQKRENLNKNYENISDIYFQNSLNQKLFNAVKLQKQKLNRFNIYLEMQKSMKEHRLENIITQNSIVFENFHNFHQQSSYSRRSQMDDYFCIDEKKFDNFVMENTFKIISIRLFHEGENCFYFAKKIFSKLFNKELRLQKQIRSITIEPYKGKIKQIQESMEKYFKKQENLQIHQFITREILNKSQMTSKAIKKTRNIQKNVKKNQIKIKINQRIVPIGFYEYYCLRIFVVIYEALSVIEEFLKRSENKRMDVIQHLASLYYSKYQNRLLSVTENPKFGLLSIGLDKLVQVITHKNKEFQTMNYELFVQYDERDRQIITFVKQIQSLSVSESSTFKRQHSISQLINQKIEDQLIDEEIFQHGRKMVK